MKDTTPPPPHEALRAAKRGFLARFDAYCTATGRKPGGVSDVLFGSSKKVREMRDPDAPKDVNVEVLAAADKKLEALAADAGITLPASVENAESETMAARPLQNGAAA
jgi:hypothetical protein